MSDADESSAIESPVESGKKKLDPGFSRNLKIIGGVLGGLLVVFVGIFLIGSGGGDDTAAASRVDLGTGRMSTPNEELSPAMSAMVAEQQIAEARAAAARGQSYIPPDTVGRAEPIELAPALPPTQSTYAQTSLAGGNNPQSLAASDDRRRRGLEVQLAMLAGADDGGTVRARITPTDNNASRAASATVTPPAAAAAAPGGGAVGAQGARQLIAGLDILSASIANDLAVPANAAVFASAMVNGGPYSGAYLIGSARVVNEALEIAFTQMRIGDAMYRVDAIVLDEGTAANAISGSVDRKILTRYVIPVAMAVAQGFFQAKSQTGTTQVPFGNEAAIVTPPSTTEQARSAGIAKGLEIGQQEVQRLGQEPIVVNVGRNTPVGLLFRAPVTEESK